MCQLFGIPIDNFVDIVSLIALFNNANNEQDAEKLSKLKSSFDE